VRTSVFLLEHDQYWIFEERKIRDKLIPEGEEGSNYFHLPGSSLNHDDLSGGLGGYCCGSS